MSCLYLYYYAEKYWSSNGDLSRLLKELFEIDLSGPDCYTYEKFHVAWEALRSYSLVSSNSNDTKCLISVKSKLYNGKGQIGSGINSEENIYLHKNMVVCYDFDEISKLLRTVLTPNGELVDKFVLTKIYHLGGRSEGVDALCFHETKDGKLTVRLFSSIYAETDNGDKQNITEIKKCYNQAIDIFKNYPNIQDRLYFVAHCWRDRIDHIEIPDRAIILSKEELTKLYASLNQTPQLRRDKKYFLDIETRNLD
jgi:hypothetical protein